MIPIMIDAAPIIESPKAHVEMLAYETFADGLYQVPALHYRQSAPVIVKEADEWSVEKSAFFWDFNPNSLEFYNNNNKTYGHSQIDGETMGYNVPVIEILKSGE